MNQHVIIRSPAQQILFEVASKHKIGVEDIKSRHRQQYLVVARLEATHRLYEETDLTVNKIARLLKRDHSTISYYIGNKIKEKRSYSKKRRVERSYVLRRLSPEAQTLVLQYAKAEQCTPETIIAQWVGERARYEAEAKARSAA